MSRHTSEPTRIACEWPGCKVEFTRKDNLLRHKEKYHSASHQSPAELQSTPRADLISPSTLYPVTVNPLGNTYENEVNLEQQRKLHFTRLVSVPDLLTWSKFV